MTDKIKYMMNEFLSRDFEFDDSICNKFYKYYEMLIEKNKVMNLTAITEFKDVVTKHFIDSILISKSIDFDKVENIIDIGTGAGFPGLPLKIIFPEKQIVLMDSLKKRTNFLQDVISELDLNDIYVVHSRAEDLARNNEYREKFDLVVSRAVANLSTLSEYCLPFAKVGGIFVSYKSDTIDDELYNSQNAIKLLGGKYKNKDVIDLDDDTKRTFIIIEKNSISSKKYPRKAGTPAKEPLK